LEQFPPKAEFARLVNATETPSLTRNEVVSGRVVAPPECFKPPTPTLNRRADGADHLSHARPFMTPPGQEGMHYDRIGLD
jgi:hypothetical protein